MNPGATRSTSSEDPAVTRSRALSPILTIKTSFKNTMPNVHDLPPTDDLDEDMASIHSKLEAMKLAPPAPALRNHVDLPADSEEEHQQNSAHAEWPGSPIAALSPLDLDAQRRFSFPVRERFADHDLRGTPMMITESHQQLELESSTLVEEPESYTEPSLLLEGVSADQIKASARHLFVREHRGPLTRDEVGEHDIIMDTTSGS